MLVKMTKAQAKALGILYCKHCLCPPNNHFGDGRKGGKCAHDNNCPGYEEVVILPGDKNYE